jgi:hypothetical protein
VRTIGFAREFETFSNSRPKNDFVVFGNPLLELGICGMPVEQVHLDRKIGLFKSAGEQCKLADRRPFRRNNRKIDVRERFRALSKSRLSQA